MLPLRLIIHAGNQIFAVDTNGSIGRPSIGLKPSHTWRLTGAVARNNFGAIVKRYSLADVLAGNVTKWQHANGKQRVFVCDTDHGTAREWGSPGHTVAVAPAGWNPYK